MDDIFGKKKEVVPILDLSKSSATTREEFKRMIEKVPDYKMRPIKVRSDEIRFKEKEYGFKMQKKELRMLMKNSGERDKLYAYMDPIPCEMRNLVILELCSVPIDWKMLTSQRPKTKVEEDYFSKLVELGKLQIKTIQRDKRENLLATSVRKVKNRSGIIESRVFTCNECMEEFCNGKTCADFNYDLYTRVVPKVPLLKTNSQQQLSLNGGGTGGGGAGRMLGDLNQKSIDSGSGTAGAGGGGGGKKGRKGGRKKGSKAKAKSVEAVDEEGNQSTGGNAAGGHGGGKKKGKRSSRSKTPPKSKSMEK
ncbi:keratin, type II cytoskeletal 1 [Anopheles stephensi]|uniref:keratin, type II cytoskeletal 1 n=1 Tax=Anopheles stephensi TaxID=30069 RepID=UPI0007D33D35|nr:keratin, type II cytoskeletal 1 [Anopheles stephensi]XP_035905598.1 keratin, type II cytoskeletal 1 [Anopheles stephensi]XP_035905599.1 keratin, type II cytoskeletal 1 [Anopheles stephensi]